VIKAANLVSVLTLAGLFLAGTASAQTDPGVQSGNRGTGAALPSVLANDVPGILAFFNDGLKRFQDVELGILAVFLARTIAAFLQIPDTRTVIARRAGYLATESERHGNCKDEQNSEHELHDFYLRLMCTVFPTISYSHC